MIDIVSYDASWPIRFEAEAVALWRALGSSARSIDHVGSTAVPGLAAKPIIDIQVSVEPLQPIHPYVIALENIGYTHVRLGDFDLVYPYFEKPSVWPHTHHLHLCLTGSEQERVHLAFRDYLRVHRDVAEQYVELKRCLAAQNSGNTIDSRERYSLAKSEFVGGVVARALAEGYPRKPSGSGV